MELRLITCKLAACSAMPDVQSYSPGVICLTPCNGQAEIWSRHYRTAALRPDERLNCYAGYLDIRIFLVVSYAL